MNKIITNSIVFISMIIFVFLLFSCGEKSKTIQANEENFSLEISLPRFVNLNEDVEGHIIYRSENDTIKFENNERRYIFLYLAKSKNPSDNFRELKKSKIDTFAIIENGIIPIFDIQFSESGDMFLDGYIIDEVFSDKNNGLTKISTIETKIAHPIKVIPKK